MRECEYFLSWETCRLNIVRRMTGDGGEPFAVQLLGVKNYFIIRPSEITQAFRNMTTLSFDRFMDDYLCCFGVKKEDVPAMNADMIKLDRNLSETTAYPAEGHDMKKFIEWTYKRQLAVDKVTELWLTYFAAVQETTSFKTLQARSSTTNGKGVVEMDLRGLLSCTLTVSVTRMLFGTKLIEIEPNMPKHVHGLSTGSGNLCTGIRDGRSGTTWLATTTQHWLHWKSMLSFRVQNNPMRLGCFGLLLRDKIKVEWRSGRRRPC
jgi:uncharacterized protein YifE (UPF0438 family)